jgi:predicted ATPase
MKLEPMNTLRPSIVSLASEGDILSRFDGKMHSSPMDIKREESPTPRDVLIKSSFVDSKASDLKTTDPALKSKLFQVLDPSQDSSNDFDASDASEDSSESGQPSLPEDKLYGREKEQASLSDTFQRITQLKTPKKLEFVLISGPSGTGKSKLAQSLQERVQAEGGYFCSGKFDQLNQAHPMSPLVAAFNDYVQQIIAEGEESIKRVRAALLREVGSDLWIVAQVMPAIADLVGKENVVDDQCCTGAMVAAKRGACAIHAIKKMMRAISSPERPLVLMLDDLQWATQTPLRKLRAMVTDPLNDGVLFVATCRDDVASNSELSSFLRELEDDEVQITNIALSNLSYPVIAELVEDKLGLPAAKSTAMSEFLFKRSDGNISLFSRSFDG